MSESEIKDLIKVVGINLLNINLIWVGLFPCYSMPPIFFNINFYGFKYKFNIYNILPYLQIYLTIKTMYNIKNA